MVNVNRHANEHGRQEREYVRLHQHDDDFEPGNPDGTYIQNVELIGYQAHPTASFTAGGKTIALKYPDDYIANSRHNRAETKVANSDIVFVGGGAIFDLNKGVKMQQITDGTSNTIMMVQTVDAVTWTAPNDIEFGPKIPLPKLRSSGGGRMTVACRSCASRVRSVRGPTRTPAARSKWRCAVVSRLPTSCSPASARRPPS